MTMQQTPLLLHRLLDRGPRLQPDEFIVTKVTNGYHRITYREHMHRVYKLASALDQWGVKVGDRVGTFCWNTARHLQAYHAVPCMGAVLHTINIRLNPKEIGYLIEHAGNRILIVDSILLPTIEQVPPKNLEKIELVIVCGADEKPGGWKTKLPQRAVDWDDFVASGKDYFKWPEIDENSPMGLCYTSGTTGNPKGVAYTHRSTYLHTITAGLPDVLNLKSTDILLPVVPMFHAMAWGLHYVALMLGARVCHLNNFMNPEKTLEFLIDEGVTFAAGVPTIWQNIRIALQNNDELRSRFRVSRLFTGGSAPPVELLQWFKDTFNTEFAQCWGMTETNPVASVSNRIQKRKHLTMTSAQQMENIAKQGLLVPGLEFKIVDTADLDRELPQDGNTTGELLIRGPWVTGAYYGGEGKDKFHKGWLITGDVASIDPEGYLIIRDRSKDLIKSGGEWISSVDLENHICAFPGVAMACVVAQPHPQWDERPIAIVVPATGAKVTKEGILAHCREKFAKFQLPDDILFWSAIPMTSTGKLSKKDVRQKLKDIHYTLPTTTSSSTSSSTSSTSSSKSNSATPTAKL